MKKLIVLIILIISLSPLNVFAQEAPEWLNQRHYVDVDGTRFYLEFHPLPYGPGANYYAWLRWQEFTHFSPQPSEDWLFLGPIVYHGTDLRLGGHLEGFKFVRGYDGTTETSSLWFFKDGIELTTEE